MKNKVLIIEDDRGITRLLKTTLSANGYDIITAATGADGLNMVSSHCPDVILLDLGMPDMDGTQIIEKVRSWSSIPIIVISARSDENDKAGALDLGADDYLSKPFSNVELLARIRAAIRHTITCSGNDELARTGVYKVYDLAVDYNKHRVFVAGKDCHLTPNEFRIVALLAKHAGKVLTYNHIMRELWGPNLGGDNKILRVHMANIRRKIEPNPASPIYIFTEIGVGYRRAEEED